MSKRLELKGQRFGYLIISDRAKNNKWDQVCWNYICDCGNKGVVIGAELTRTRNPKTHCGCLTSKHYSDVQMKNSADLTGQTFGNLIVLKRVGTANGRSLWLMRCNVKNCGKEIEAPQNRLTHKTTPMTHCGCLSYQNRVNAVKQSNTTHGLYGTPEYWIEKAHRRRSKKQNNNSTFNLSYAETFKMARPKIDYCVYCGSTDNLSTDHIIPIDKGGNQDYKNLIRACSSCNSSKNASFFIDWYLKTKRCKRSLTEIITDMGFDSIYHLQHYQDSMCTDYYEKNRSMVAAKILKAERKSIKFLDRYYQSLDHYPTH